MEPIVRSLPLFRSPICRRTYEERLDCEAHIVECRKGLDIDGDIVGKTVVMVDEINLCAGIVKAVLLDRHSLLVDAVTVGVEWGAYHIRHNPACMVPIADANVVDPKEAKAMFRSRVRAIAERRLDEYALAYGGDAE